MPHKKKLKTLGQVDSFINDNRSLHEFFCLMHCCTPFPSPRKTHHRNFLCTLSEELFKMNKTKKKQILILSDAFFLNLSCNGYCVC